jgi:hypothetical protein
MMRTYLSVHLSVRLSLLLVYYNLFSAVVSSVFLYQGEYRLRL